MQPQERFLNNKWRLLACLLLLGLTVAACRPSQQNEPDQLSGAVLLWHDLGAEDALVLDQVLTNFVDIHPNVKVKATSLPPAELHQRFENAVRSGLGPDLLLGPSSWIKPLADAGRIQPIDGLVEPEFWARYVPTSIAASQYDDHFYAIPESLRMMGLYYNKSLVDNPPASLDELMEQVVQGSKIGMSPDFADMFWGIRAFGGELLNENGQVVLDRGGFANWLAWLTTAEDGPNFLIDRDRKTLRTLFGDRELAYLVDGSWAAQELQGLIGEEQLGVAPLPAGPIGPASPLLEVNAFMLSMASSQRQSELAVELAKFITNPEQATTLMRRGDRIPASDRIQVNPSVDPIAYPFIIQARNAIPFRNSLTMDTVMKVGSGAYNRALQGVEGPVEVANNISQAINQALGIPSENGMASMCQQLGVLDIWHTLNEADTQAFLEIVESFRENCPYVAVRLTDYAPETLHELLASGTAPAPDVALVPSQWVTSLVEAQSIRSLTGTIPAERLQAFQPSAVQSWTAEERLYGVPFTLELPALYYNRALVSDPARTLDDIIDEGGAERTTALNIAFDQAYWGVPAFGGKLFDEDGRAVLDQGGFAEWLAWLQNARAREGTVLSKDADRLLELFLSEAVAYYVGGPDALASAETALGKENVGVARLPTGPVADAAPLVTSRGFVIPSNASDEGNALALLFVEDATGVESQRLLMEAGRKVPVNVAVDHSVDPAISAFLERSSNAAVYPNLPEMAAVEEFAGKAYDAILDEPLLSQADLEVLVLELTELINLANGFPASQSIEEGAENAQ